MRLSEMNALLLGERLTRNRAVREVLARDVPCGDVATVPSSLHGKCRPSFHHIHRFTVSNSPSATSLSYRLTSSTVAIPLDSESSQS